LDGRVLDVDLLCYVADSQPEWSVLLIGPEFRHTANFRNLRKRKNIHFLGGRPHGDMPRYVSSLDVCMIPYRLNEFTNNVSPLKLYEYLAAGKPVVSTKLAGLADFKDIVRIADTKEGFIKEIALSLTEDDQGLVQRRRDAARENSWERRLQFVSGLMEKMDENRKG
jgi:glycosyltransferase involved in cell wall biosynthesis